MKAMDDTQLEAFLREGWLRLPGAIPAPLLQRLRDLFDELMSGADESLLVKNTNKGVTYITNVEKPCCRGNLAGLETLGFPFILDLARTICGDDFFCFQDFGVVKMLGDNTPVLWHQDMLHERTGRCFVMGIYLDDADAGDGALKVVPRSHASGRHICALQREPHIDVPMQAGDILVHDMMLAHCSDPLTRLKLRRVLYLIFLSAAHVRGESIYPGEVIERRMKVLDIAIQYYQRLHPDEARFDWRSSEAGTFDDHARIREVLEELNRAPLKPRPSAYCFEVR